MKFDELDDTNTLGIVFDTYEQLHYIKRKCSTGRWLSVRKLTDRQWQTIKSHYGSTHEALWAIAKGGTANANILRRSRNNSGQIQDKK